MLLWRATSNERREVALSDVILLLMYNTGDRNTETQQQNTSVVSLIMFKTINQHKKEHYQHEQARSVVC